MPTQIDSALSSSGQPGYETGAKVAIAAAGVVVVEDRLERIAPRLGRWPPERPAVDDPMG